MPTKLILPSGLVSGPAEPEPGLDKFLNVETLQPQPIAPATRGAPVEEHALEDARDDDIVEVELASGIREWVSVAQFRADLGQAAPTKRAAASQPAEPGVLRVPERLPVASATRGVTDWVLKGLKILRISPAEALAKAGAREIVEHFESKLEPGPGLYRLIDPETMGERVTSPNSLKGEAPILVFIHGTASSTAGGFGGLKGTPEWEELNKIYGERILAFEHRTLSQNPIENALELAQLLPKGARLHLVSHSRGGLVGECLCLAPLTSVDFQPFVKSQREETVKLLRQLSSVLAEKQFRIERFVRVACPARGTILASKRLDKYLSVLLNVVGLIPALRVSPTFAFLKATLLELAKRRTEPQDIPGLEAQMPESPLIHLLNRPGLVSKADLGVIAGDVETGGFLGTLKTWATDLFYREDHDLVVNTDAMYGGMTRQGGAYRFFDQGPEVNHFNYFRNEETRARLLEWLTQPDEQRKGKLFQPITRAALPDLEVRGTRDVAKDRPVVFLLPGLMGSHLKDKRGRVWLEGEVLALGAIERLAGSNGKVEPDGVLANAYQRLVQHLEQHFAIVPFPYDWRLSHDTEAARLAKAVTASLKELQQPVYFVAHSSGGLLVRAMIAQDPALWGKVCARQGRCVLLGTPTGGTYVVPRLLTGEDTALCQLALLDSKHTDAELAALFAGWPGMLELLPENNSPDLLKPDTWKKLRDAAAPAPALLQQARQFRQKLDKADDYRNHFYVAGTAPATPCALEIEAGVPVFKTTTDGDGRVPYDLGLLPNVPTWYVNAEHGDLADAPAAFPAIVDLLKTGQTDQLPQRPTPPPATRGAEMPLAREPVLFPTEDELAAAAIGASRRRRRPQERHTLKVSVVHGDLSQAKYPVAVGHYQGDSIVSAEKSLDQRLGGRLSGRFRMDLYPGPEGTVEVIEAPNCQPSGALIIGLGHVGEITAEKVRRGVCAAALHYALAMAEKPRPDEDASCCSAAFSTVLLGTYGGNALSVETSLAAVLHGVISANRTLRDLDLWSKVRIDEIEIVELYEDAAIEAIHAAHRCVEHPPTPLLEHEALAVEPPYLLAVTGGRFQRPANPYAAGWWRRILITELKEASGPGSSGLKFLVLTDRARAEGQVEPTQRKLIDEMVARTLHSPQYDPQLASALFELLVPNSLKDQASAGADLVLVLDNQTAQYPWELLATRTRNGFSSPALQIGLLRQFATTDSRPNPQPARDRNVLIIGDTESGFAPLPGAQHEATTVKKILASFDYRPKPLLASDAVTIVNELFARDYKILHFAAHGLYDPKNPTRSGVVLGKDLFLTPAEIAKLRAVPELVFLNCCHLGRIDEKPTVESRNLLAASLSEELIKIGVKAVIAAGWAVDDRAAATFAREFYSEMLAGRRLGEAVLAARSATHNDHQHTNTWGAYQCYGNPDFSLEKPPEEEPTEAASGTGASTKATRVGATGAGATSRPAPRCYARREYLDRLRTIAGMAKNATVPQAAALLEQVRALDKSLPALWRDGRLLAALGEAYGELGDFESAIDRYKQAIRDEGAEAPIKTVEQLANLLSRHAAALRDTKRNPRRFIREATEWLDWVARLGETSERLALHGSTFKRLARAASAEQRRQMLRKACFYYGKAHEAALREDGAIDPYPALNWATYRFLLGDKNPKELLDLIGKCRAVPPRPGQSERDFWYRVRQPDAALLEHLVQGNLPANVNTMVKQYRQVVADGASQRQIASVRDQIAFLAEMLRGRASAGVLQALEKIQQAI